MTISNSAATGAGAVTPLRDLLGLLDLHRVAADEFAGRAQEYPADRVFGGLLLAQAVVAAARTAPEGHVPLALQADFLRGVSGAQVLRWRVERIADASSMSVRRTTLTDANGGELFTATSRWGMQRDDLTTYSSARPRPTPGPERLPDLEDRFGDDERVPMWWRMRRPVFFRHVEPPPYTAPVGPAQDFQSVWVRARGDVHADAALEAALLAYVSDMSVMEPVFRASGSARHTPGSRILSLSHHVAFHARANLSSWHQMDSSCPTVAGGRALGTGDFFDHSGRHVASVSQLALVNVA